MNTEVIKSENRRNVERQFEWVGVASSTLALAGTAGFVASIKSVNPSLVFGLDWKVPVSFLIVACLSFLGSRALFLSSTHGAECPSRVRRHWLYTVGVLGVGGMIGGMAYSLKGVSTERLADVAFGVVLAVAFLSIACYLLFRTVRFLESEEIIDETVR